MAEVRKAVDWEAVEREYRAGQLSVSEIGRQHGLTEGAIRKRAKRDDWQRDLSDRVRTAVRMRAVRDAVRQSDPARTKATENEIVEAAAERGATAVKGHLARANGLKAHADRISALLSDVMSDDEEKRTKAAGIICLAKGDGLGSTLRALADVVERVQRLERQALNIDDEGTGDGGAIIFDSTDAKL
jgi:hypothetical protein